MISDYKREFEKERQRLAQLWEANEAQGVEIEQLRSQVQRLEITVMERDELIGQMKRMLEQKDGELQELRSP